MLDRTLDALVAQHIMGYVFVNGRDDDWYSMLKTPEAAKEWLAEFPGCLIEDVPRVERANVLLSLVPNYSTDMTAAWKVIENIRGRMFSVRQRFTAALQIECSRSLTAGQLAAFSEVPLLMTAEDICRAALKTVGVAI